MTIDREPTEDLERSGLEPRPRRPLSEAQLKKRRAAASKGGQATLRKHGREFFSRIGKNPYGRKTRV